MEEKFQGIAHIQGFKEAIIEDPDPGLLSSNNSYADQES
jgi:hypothetical protein